MITQATYKNHPARLFVPRVDTKVSDVMRLLPSPIYSEDVISNSHYVSSTLGGKMPPEHVALRFYLYQHAFSSVSAQYHEGDKLPGGVCVALDEYCAFLEVEVSRMFYYIFFICAREARHLNDGDYKSLFLDALIEEKDKRWRDYFSDLTNDSCGRFDAIQLLITKAADFNLLELLKYFEEIFYGGMWSSGFGGEAWGRITTTLIRYVKGELSGELFLDAAFSLCHNNGPIFNKDMFFRGHSDLLQEILDVQHSGQLPSLVISGEGYATGSSDLLGNTNPVDLGPGEWPTHQPYVDWASVWNKKECDWYAPKKIPSTAKNITKPKQPPVPSYSISHSITHGISPTPKIPKKYAEKSTSTPSSFTVAPWMYLPIVKVKRKEKALA